MLIRYIVCLSRNITGLMCKDDGFLTLRFRFHFYRHCNELTAKQFKHLYHMTYSSLMKLCFNLVPLFAWSRKQIRGTALAVTVGSWFASHPVFCLAPHTAMCHGLRNFDQNGTFMKQKCTNVEWKSSRVTVTRCSNRRITLGPDPQRIRPRR